jgi:hypothetical protein
VSFSKPVVVQLPEAKGGPRIAEILDSRQGIAAMSRDGLGGYDLKDSLWVSTFDLLTKATLHPTPETIEAAREALVRLARRGAH